MIYASSAGLQGWGHGDRAAQGDCGVCGGAQGHQGRDPDWGHVLIGNMTLPAIFQP